MSVSITESNFQKLKPKVTPYRNFKNFPNDTFGKYLLSKLSIENINTSSSGLKQFFNICVSAPDNTAPREKKFLNKKYDYYE